MSRNRALLANLKTLCPYCGYRNTQRPPAWCVRRHEEYEAANDRALADVMRAPEPGAQKEE